MSSQKLGYSLIGIGVFIILLMLLADTIGLGHGGIQAAQLLGVEIGLGTALLGYFLTILFSEKIQAGEGLYAWVERLLASPVTAIVIGILVAFILFSIVPMFFTSDLRFQYFYRYLPDKYPIGLDLQTLLNRVKTWFEIGTPYPGDVPQFYPPLTYMLFAPLTMLSYRAAYATMTFITLLSYIVLTLLLPIWIAKRNYWVIFLLFALGLFSYGFQFELERGQYNVLTFLLCILAIYIFHFHHKFRYIAYLLFSVAIQLKVFPAIFIFMFIKDWRDWKNNIKRFVGLGLFNIVLLFILGYRVVFDFIHAITTQVVTPSWNWNGNHSVQAFVFNLMKDGYGLIRPEVLPSLSKFSSLITVLFMAIFALCLVTLLVSAYRFNENGLNPYLLLACTIGALIIPTSNDYTLSFLVAPVAIFFASISMANAFKTKYLANVLVVIASFAFCSTLFPFKYKPYFLNNNFPALFLILVSITLLYFLRNRNVEPEALVENP